MPITRKLQISAAADATDLAALLQRKLGLAQPIRVLMRDADFDEDCEISELGDIATDKARVKVVPLHAATADDGGAAAAAKVAAAQAQAAEAEQKAAAATQTAAEAHAAAEEARRKAEAEAEARRKAEAAAEAKQQAEAAFELVGAGTAAANGPYRRDGARPRRLWGLAALRRACLLLTSVRASGARRRVRGQAALLPSGRPRVEGAVYLCVVLPPPPRPAAAAAAAVGAIASLLSAVRGRGVRCAGRLFETWSGARSPTLPLCAALLCATEPAA